MPNCDMCGKETGMLFRTLVEGVQLNVCKGCSSFGKVLEQVKVIEKAKKTVTVKPEEPETIEIVVPEYAEIIRKARERLNLKQEDLAKKINERASLIQNIERDRFKPSMHLAKKLEKFLHIKLIESVQDSQVDVKKIKSEGLTIGDFIKVKKR